MTAKEGRRSECETCSVGLEIFTGGIGKSSLDWESQQAELMFLIKF